MRHDPRHRMVFPSLVAAFALGALACGGDDDGSGGAADAAASDGATAPTDAGILGQGESRTYVVDSVNVPIDAEEAEAFGFDLDGDDMVDNQLGSVMTALTQSAGNLDLQGMTDEQVDRGGILLLVDLRATALTDADSASVSIYRGENPDPEPCTDVEDLLSCRQHLNGEGTFDAVANQSPAGHTVRGDVEGGVFTGGPGNLVVQFAFFGGVVTVPLIEARARLTGLGEDELGNSAIGGAVTDDEVQATVIPTMHEGIVASIAVDCTGIGEECGCEPDSTGRTLVDIFDEDDDCEVTLTEVRENNLIEALLGPDVDTDGDDELDALSVGFGVTAVAGAFTPPS